MDLKGENNDEYLKQNKSDVETNADGKSRKNLDEW
jgi:hypothetical protein